MKHALLVTCFALLAATLFAQADTARHRHHGSMQRQLTIVTGYYYYGRSGGEIGLGKTVSDLQHVHPLWSSVYASSEFFYNNGLFMGPKVGVCAYGGMGMGLSLIYYTNFNQSSLQLRPEVGFGMFNLRVYYGHNLHITNTRFNAVSKNLLGINVFFNAKKLALTPKQQRRAQL